MGACSIEKYCKNCSKLFIATNSFMKYCPDCKAQKKTNYYQKFDNAFTKREKARLARVDKVEDYILYTCCTCEQGPLCHLEGCELFQVRRLLKISPKKWKNYKAKLKAS